MQQQKRTDSNASNSTAIPNNKDNSTMVKKSTSHLSSSLVNQHPHGPVHSTLLNPNSSSSSSSPKNTAEKMAVESTLYLGVKLAASHSKPPDPKSSLLSFPFFSEQRHCKYSLFSSSNSTTTTAASAVNASGISVNVAELQASEGSALITSTCPETKASTIPPCTQDWRMRERLKTVSVSLMLCLNVGIDPPDIVKPNPCAKLECWVDPFSMPPQKALEAIGRNLQQQYEAWQPRARYRLSLDPSIEETKKMCCSLRRNAKEERVLLHYNGHGVPKPTVGGELWVFNKNYTQYIPVSVYDIQTWLGSPCIYVYDCHNAGNILHAFNKFAEQRDAEALRSPPPVSATPSSLPPGIEGVPDLPYVPMQECIQLAACGPREMLPMNPDLPADVFTCCLTTPIEISLRWFVSQSPLLKNVTPDMIMKIPGRLNDRRTPLGELNWIFTSITDTIAWNILPHDLFKKLFRQDLMVAALFRNFLLAERLMTSLNCHPMSSPTLPSSHQHPMWQAWDLAADMCLSQLPHLLGSENSPSAEYKHSSFFADQLTAFEVWLSKGNFAKRSPEQLPIILQVLLSQVHRLRALVLLSKFLDIGPWAVHSALSVGIFPYVLKLLQSPAAELRPVLVFIWAKILAVDRSCQGDLLKDNGFNYFINILASPVSSSMSEPVQKSASTSDHQINLPQGGELRAMCAFILSVFCDSFPIGQQACLKSDILSYLQNHVRDTDPSLRQWTCLCLGKVISGFREAKKAAVDLGYPDLLIALLKDPCTEVRAAAIVTLGEFFGDSSKDEDHVVSLLCCISDGSPIVRAEVVFTLNQLTKTHRMHIMNAAFELMEEERKRPPAAAVASASPRAVSSVETKTRPKFSVGGSSPVPQSKAMDHAKTTQHSSISVFSAVWRSLLILSVDPVDVVSSIASKFVDEIHAKLLTSPAVETAFPNLVSSFGLNCSSSGKKSGGSPYLNSSPYGSSSNSPSNSFSAGKSSSAGLSKSFGRSIAETFRRSASIASSSFLSFTMFGSVEGINSLNSSANVGYFRTPSYLDIRSALSRPSSSMVGRQQSKVSTASTLLSFKSSFFDWSCKSFTEPQMRLPEFMDPGSVRYNQRFWRKLRNDQIVQEATSAIQSAIGSGEIPPNHQPSSTATSTNSLKQMSFSDFRQLQHHSTVTGMKLHSFEPHLIVSDDESISVYNCESAMRIHSFLNGNPAGSRISCLNFINEDDQTLLLVGSNDGILRLYRNYDNSTNTELVSAWMALDGFVPLVRGPGLLTEWHQQSGMLCMAGNTPIIRLWDADQESVVCQFASETSGSLTCMTLERHSGTLLAAGCNEGGIYTYDLRAAQLNQRHTSQAVKFYDGGSSDSIIGLQFLPAFCNRSHELMAASASGKVTLYDARNPSAPVHTFLDTQDDGMAAFACHPNAPVFACKNNTLKLYDLAGGIIPHSRQNVARTVGGMPCLTFHPQNLLLAHSISSSIYFMKYQSPSQ